MIPLLLQQMAKATNEQVIKSKLLVWETRTNINERVKKEEEEADWDFCLYLICFHFSL